MSVALIFPGQGSQYIGMGKELCSSFSVASQTIEEASEILSMDIKKCWKPDYNLENTRDAQPMILAISIAAFRVFDQQIKLRPSVSAGHSLGEYTALVSSGQISFKDALNIVKVRGELMQLVSEQFPGRMIAVMHSNESDVEEIYNHTKKRWKMLTLACDNSKSNKVFSGTIEATEIFIDQLKEKNIYYKVISNSGAFHNDIMQNASNKMMELFNDLEMNKGSFPVLSNVDALPHTISTLKKMLILQITKPVRWRETMNNLVKYGAKIFVEIGPRKVLGNMLDNDKKIYTHLSFSTIKDIDQVKLILENQMDHSERIKDDLSFINDLINQSIVMKNYNTMPTNYDEIKKIYQKINNLKNKNLYNSSMNKQIIHYLLEIFSLKNISLKEQESFKVKFLENYV